MSGSQEISAGDGDIATLGSTSDAPATSPSGTNSGMAVFKAIMLAAQTLATNQNGASENHLGEVGGHTEAIEIGITTTAAGYSAGHCLGGPITVPNAVRTAGGTGLLASLHLADQNGNAPVIDALFFDRAPAATYTDHVTPSKMTKADQATLLGRVSILTTDWDTVNGISMCTKVAIGLPIKANAGTTITMILMVIGSAPTYASTSDLTMRVGVLGD